jgi:hypothetical protein
MFSPSVFCNFLIGAAVVLGLISVAASFLPFDFLHTKARLLSRTGQIPFFTPDFYYRMRTRLQFIGASSLVVGFLTFVFRRRVRYFLAMLVADVATFTTNIAREWKAIPVLDLWTLAGVIILAAVLRIPLLSQPMRYDEAFTVMRYASKPLYVGLSLYTEPNNHLFHTLLVHIAYVLFGDRPWALRLPAFFAGLLLVPATYVAARSLYRTEGAILASVLTGCSSLLIEYSTSSRGYSLVCLFFMMLIPIAAYLLRNQSWAAWLLFAILAALGFYTIPIMLYPLGGLAVWLLLSDAAGDATPPRGRIVSGLVVAGLFTATLTTALYSPVFAVSGPSPVFANRWVRSLPYRTFLKDFPVSLLSTWREWNRELPLLFIIVLAAGFGISLIWHRRCSQFRVPLPLALIAWLVLILSIQRVVPFERVWMFALPLYFAASTAGLAFLATRLSSSSRIRHGMIFVAAAICLWAAWHVGRSNWIYSTNEGRGMQATAMYLQPRLTPGDSVLVALPSDAPLEYYFSKQRIPIAYLNAPISHRVFVVVNHVADDTLAKVLAMEKINAPTPPGTPVAQFDSVSLYEFSAIK